MSDEATKPCPYCAETIKAAAVVCRFCGRSLAPTAPAPVAPPPSVPARSSKIGPILLLVMVVALILFCLNVLGGKTKKDNAVFVPDRVSAFVDCKSFVTKTLKSPSTASFPTVADPDVKINSSGGKWTVSGYVDAQNAFGAMLRQDFECELTYSGETVTIQHLVVGDQVVR